MQSMQRVAVLDFRTQVRLHRVAWNRALSLPESSSRTYVLLVLMLHVAAGLVMTANAVVLPGMLAPEHTVAAIVVGVVLMVAGVWLMNGGPACVWLAWCQGARVWTNSEQTAFALVRTRRGYPAPFSHFALPGHGAQFRASLVHMLLGSHDGVLVRAANPKVRELYLDQAGELGLAVTRHGGKDVVLRRERVTGPW